MNYLWRYGIDFFQILVVASPEPYAQTFLALLDYVSRAWILFILVNMGSNGSENFKRLLLLQIAAKSFETCPEFSSQWSQNYVGDFWNFEFPIFNVFFFFRKFQVHYCSLWRNQKPQLYRKRAIVEQTEVKFGTHGQYFDIYGVPLALPLKVILRSFGALAIFRKYDFQ